MNRNVKKSNVNAGLPDVCASCQGGGLSMPDFTGYKTGIDKNTLDPAWNVTFDVDL